MLMTGICTNISKPIKDVLTIDFSTSTSLKLVYTHTNQFTIFSEVDETVMECEYGAC